MPLYEYKCDRCGDVFEVIQKFSDAPLERHQGCGGAVERLISAAALQFKGSGWYVTDYARSGKSNSEGKSESKSESKSEGKSKAESTDKGGDKGGANGTKTESSKPAAPASTETKSK
jgi:putative FmdB family regulatory protein